LAAGQLAQAVGAMSLEKPSDEMLERSLGELNRRIFDLIHSNSASDRLGAVLAISRLVDRPDFDGNDGQLARYANYLRVVLPCRDAALMREAAGCLGKIVAQTNVGMHEMVEFELGRVLQWFQGTRSLIKLFYLTELKDKSETSQLAACFVAETLLLNSNTISNAYLSTLFDALWTMMREPKSGAVQEASSRAMKAALAAVKARYDSAGLGQFAQRALVSLGEELRGGGPLSALLILGHLIGTMAEVLNLENSGDLFEQLLSLTGSRVPGVRHNLFELVPALAAQAPHRFAERFLDRWIAILVDALKKDKDRTLGIHEVMIFC